MQLGSIRQNNSIAAGGASGAQGILFVPVEFGPPPNFFRRAGDLLLIPAQLEAVAGELKQTFLPSHTPRLGLIRGRHINILLYSARLEMGIPKGAAVHREGTGRGRVRPSAAGGRYRLARCSRLVHVPFYFIYGLVKSATHAAWAEKGWLVGRAGGFSAGVYKGARDDVLYYNKLYLLTAKWGGCGGL